MKTFLLTMAALIISIWSLFAGAGFYAVWDGLVSGKLPIQYFLIGFVPLFIAVIIIIFTTNKNL